MIVQHKMTASLTVGTHQCNAAVTVNAKLQVPVKPAGDARLSTQGHATMNWVHTLGTQRGMPGHATPLMSSC